MDQQALAGHFANEFSGQQRADAELLDRMSKKYGTSSTSSSLNNTAPTPQRRASALSKPRERDTDWEERALQGIKAKELSLDRQWNELTWKQKSSCHERLKLLKDDGVDIAPLLGPKLNSDAIVRAVMAQIDLRKRQPSSNGSAQPAVNGGTASLMPSEPVAHSPRTALDPLAGHLEDRSLSTRPSKRKRVIVTYADEIDPSESHTLTDEDESSFKRRCTMDLRLFNKDIPEEEVPTWDLLKSKILRDLHERGDNSIAHKAVTSSIVINFPSQSAALVASDGFDLNSSGYDNIMLDLRVLGGPEDDDGNFGIVDPHTGNVTRIITNEPRRTIIEGDTDFLIALVARFRTPGKGLLHIAKRYFDELAVRQGRGQAFELGKGTHGELEVIEEELRKGKETGEGFEVQVMWKYVGKTGKWPEKMY